MRAVWNPLRRRAYYRARTGIAALEGGNLEGAERHLNEALDLDHEFSDARLWLGHLYEQKHDPGAALTQYRLGLVFDPENVQLTQAAQTAETGAAWAGTKAAKQLKAARSRRVVNIIFALLVPCAGFFMGLWEIATAATPEWRDLGVRTLLCSLLGMLLHGMFYMVLMLLVGSGGAP
jgi:tetratricopeptide (TPR) repeat protein